MSSADNQGGAQVKAELETAIESLQQSHLRDDSDWQMVREHLVKLEAEVSKWRRSFGGHVYVTNADYSALVERATTAEIRAEVAEKAAADWKYLATLRRGFLADVEKKCDELTARLDASSPERVCQCDCLTAADVGVSLPGNPVAYANPECKLHNSESHFSTSDSEGES